MNRAAASRHTVDIDGNAARFLSGRDPDARYASFDYCHNYFASAYDEGRLEGLLEPDELQTACVQLGFYLASWGMFRGRAQLLSHSARRLRPVIEAAVAAPNDIWKVDAGGYTAETIQLVLSVGHDLRAALPGGQSDTLVTKTMLGVFGCVPAFDRFFRAGFGASTFGPKALQGVGAFCDANEEAIERYRVPTFGFDGADTGRLYSQAKVIDMVFFIEGGG